MPSNSVTTKRNQKKLKQRWRRGRQTVFSH